jgi:hypothetical protein
MRNAAAPLAALANIPDSDLLGALFSVSCDSALCVPVEAVNAAFSAVGFASTVGAHNARARFQELIGNGAKRVNTRKGKDKHRSITGAKCDHKEKGLLSFEYSVNLPTATTETANLAPIGVVTFNEANGQAYWRYACGPQERHESATAYRERAFDALSGKGVNFGDLRDFAEWADAALADIARFDRATCHGSASIKRALTDYFERVRCFPVGLRGGSYFGIRDGGQTCAYERTVALAAALDKATNGAVRMAYFPTPKVQASVEATTEIVRSSFMEEIGKIEEEIGKLTAHRYGQNDGRKEALLSILDKLDTYRALWGLAGDDIRDAAAKVQAMIEGHDTATTIKAAPKAAKAAARDAAEAVTEGAKAAAADRIASGEAIAEALVAALMAGADTLDTDGALTCTEGGTTLTVEADPVLDFAYKIKRGAVVVASGAAGSLREIAERVHFAL